MRRAFATSKLSSVEINDVAVAKATDDTGMMVGSNAVLPLQAAGVIRPSNGIPPLNMINFPLIVE
jgi:hypothetical protein